MLDKQTILEYLDSDNIELILDGLFSIEKKPFPEAIPKVLNLLKHSDWSVKYNAINTLGDIGIDDLNNVGNKLLELLKTCKDNSDIECELTRNEIVEILGYLEYYPALDLIIDLLINDKSPIVRASAAQVIGYIGTDKDITLLQEVVNNVNECESIKSYAKDSIKIIKKEYDYNFS